jgi:hypothetical protein
MRFARFPLASLLLLPAALAQTPRLGEPPPLTPAAPVNPAPKKSSQSEWVFSLLPKSLQKNPRLDLTVITEMTEDGKKLPPVSPEKPAYYITQSAGYHQMGQPPGGEKTLPQEDVEKILARSLAANGYLAAQPPTQPPSLLIIYTWGSDSLLVEGDDENPSLSPDAVMRNVLDRAALVGGEKFAKELLQLFTEADAMATAVPTHMAPGGQSPMTPEMMAFANPVNLFKLRSPKNEFLVEQSAEDVYYVVASAYDYRSAANNQKRLLWRTRMTVGAQGVSQEQTLPTLIGSAAPYFGREMLESEIMTRRVMPEGRVEIGTPVVVEPTAPKPPVPTPVKP